MSLLRDVFEFKSLRAMKRLLQASSVGVFVVSLYMIVLSKPWGEYDMLYKPVRWVRELLFKRRMRALSFSKPFAGYHNVEISSIRTHNCVDL